MSGSLTAKSLTSAVQKCLVISSGIMFQDNYALIFIGCFWMIFLVLNTYCSTATHGMCNMRTSNHSTHIKESIHLHGQCLLYVNDVLSQNCSAVMYIYLIHNPIWRQLNDTCLLLKTVKVLKMTTWGPLTFGTICKQYEA